MLKAAEQLLKKHYGYTSFRPGQEQVITSLLKAQDTLAIMPTGAGKSICFQIPALLFKGITLVISPLISLMKDQVDSLTSVDIPSTFINSSLTQSQVNDRILAAKSGCYKLIYIAPERLESEAFCQTLNSLELSMIAIDEAHCVSEWGHDFRPSYRAISKFIASLNKRPIVGAFTATATQSVKQDIISLLSLQHPDVYITGFDRSNLSFSVLRGENKTDFTLKYLTANKNQSGIIYAATRKEVDTLHSLLLHKGFTVGKYHAGLTDEERHQYQDAFIHDDINIMVATNAFGMGIDKSNVRYVLHYNMPKNMESYYQEAGRAGRDGEPSECILLFSPQDPLLQRFLIEQNTFDAERKTHEFSKLQSMVDYCHTPECLRKYILNYFGEQPLNSECDNCSNCNDDREITDITVIAQKVFSCVLRMKERFGTVMVAGVLKGSKDKKILQLNLDALSTYGLMKEYKLQEIKDIINRLIATEYMYLTDSEYPVVKLSPKALPVLKNTAKVLQKMPKQPPKTVATNTLFELLRTLRKEIADREKVPPYVVFADSTLKEMCEHLPANAEELLKIKGIGESKLKRYGQEFLETINKYMQEHEITLTNSSNNKEEKPSHIVTLELYNNNHSIVEISALRKLTLVTIQDHLIRCSTEGYDVNLDSLIPQKYAQLIFSKIKELGASKLKTLKEALPEEVDYLAIKAAICKYSKEA